jgi:arabinose-5-phosphate isomerase
MRFEQAFDVTPGDVVAFIGAGGKTSLLVGLGYELAEAGWRVLATTTTRLSTDQLDLFPCTMAAGAAPQAISEALTERFVDATGIVAATRGRIVVSGMGKSGHIANKMAATFASTGAPALFVHPAEASHGDLGMITDADTLLMLSNSGETPELADLVNYGKRFRIPLIAIVGRAPSTLAEAATVALVLPDEPEAGTLGLAPTTSTIMMLALGDALAVALLERKGLTADDFKIYHPGGKLGRRLVRVADIMHAGDDLPLVPADTTMAEALIVMTAKRLGCVGATDGSGSPCLRSGLS